MLERILGVDCVYWLRREPIDELFWTRWWTWKLHKRQGVCWLAQFVCVYQEGPLFVVLSSLSELKQGTHCTYNIILWRVRVTIVMEVQQCVSFVRWAS